MANACIGLGGRNDVRSHPRRENQPLPQTTTSYIHFLWLTEGRRVITITTTTTAAMLHAELKHTTSIEYV